MRPPPTPTSPDTNRDVAGAHGRTAPGLRHAAEVRVVGTLTGTPSQRPRRRSRADVDPAEVREPPHHPVPAARARDRHPDPTHGRSPARRRTASAAAARASIVASGSATTSRGRATRTEREGPWPPRLTTAAASESTLDVEGQRDADRVGVRGRTSERRPAARAHAGLCLSSSTSPRSASWPTSDRIALRVRPVGGDELGAGQRAAARGGRGRSRSGSPDGRSRCAARRRRDRLARFVILSCKRVPDSCNRGAVSSR